MRDVKLLPVLAVCMLCCVGKSLSAPGRTADEVLIGQVDISMRSDGAGGGSSSSSSSHSTSSEDRESISAADAAYGNEGNNAGYPGRPAANQQPRQQQPFAKKCVVDNKAYSHSQLIPSRDQSSHCLCVAGEVYCWWQTFGGSSKDGFPDNKEVPAKRADEEEEEEEEAGRTSEEDEEEYSAEGSSEQPPSRPDSERLDQDNWDEQSEDENEEDEDAESNDVPQQVLAAVNSTASTATMTTTTTTTTTSSSTARPTKAPATCLFMGRRYREEELLPHSTGNCVECRCGSEGRIECSPRDCVGLRPQQPGGGDLELFDAGNNF